MSLYCCVVGETRDLRDYAGVAAGSSRHGCDFVPVMSSRDLAMFEVSTYKISAAMGGPSHIGMSVCV